MSLSAAIATFNEEENLSRCLESIQNIATEIVIVDGGSSDKTVEIAKKYGAQVIITNNPPIFHINKQKAIDKATQDWILQLDADEVVSRELSLEIKYQISNIKSKYNGFWLPRKNWFLGRFLMKGGQYPDYTLRLYRKGKGRLPQKSVHEQAEVTGKVGYLKNPLIHYPYKNFSDYLVKWNRYVVLLMNEIKEQVKNKSLFLKIVLGFQFLFIKPLSWFVLTYFRHKGFEDLWPGFIFSFFSSVRFPIAYLKYLKIL